MEEALIKLLPGLGSGGVVAVLLYMLAKRYFSDSARERELLEKSRAETYAALNSRITVLETAHKECEADRTRLWERLLDRYGKEPMAGPKGTLP